MTVIEQQSCKTAYTASIFNYWVPILILQYSKYKHYKDIMGHILLCPILLSVSCFNLDTLWCEYLDFD